jgi:hypothetical protein
MFLPLLLICEMNACIICMYSGKVKIRAFLIAILLDFGIGYCSFHNYSTMKNYYSSLTKIEGNGIIIN